jgi:hypothetical protein
MGESKQPSNEFNRYYYLCNPIENLDELKEDLEQSNERMKRKSCEESRSEHDICSEIESRIGIDLLSTDICSPDSVFESNRWLNNREWMCGVRFALSQCFTDNKSRIILRQLDDIDFSSLDRRKPVIKVIEELFNQ